MKTPARRNIIPTQDGSPTIYVPELDESYHSGFGAVQEALHIFIQAALAYQARTEKQLNILEIGFGTGLNALLTLEYAREHGLQVKYYGVEKYPVSLDEAGQLDYTKNREQFLALHQATWNSWNTIFSGFDLFKLQSDFREMELPLDYFDVVYFDAFGPDVQEHLWTAEVFALIYKAMKRGGVLTTYSVKGKVRRAMKEVGFEVEKIPGPPGKREISRARKL